MKFREQSLRLDVREGGATAPAEEERITAALRGAVLDQRLLPGMKLAEEELASIFATSRARIRRVLLSLSRENFVTLFPGRGAFVSAPTQSEAGEVLAARLLVEVGAMEQLRDRPGPAPETLRDIVRAEQAAAGRGDRSDMIRLSGAFHVALARWLGNAVVAGILEQLILRTSLVIALYEPSDGACCLPHDHKAVLDMLDCGRSADAAALMREHLLRLGDRLDFTRRPDERASLRELLRAPGWSPAA